MRAIALAACALWLVAAPSSAVVIVTGDGSGNTTAPSDDPGFAHVGVTGSYLTGIYLGYGWYLTAEHVGETSITLGGITYSAIPGSLVQLETSPDVLADLALVRINGSPPLAPLVLSSGTPVNGDTVTMVGNGFNRQVALTCWNSSFVELGSCVGPLVAFRGYERLGSTRTLRWGRNLVTGTPPIDIPMPGTTTRAFQVDFDQSGIGHEAQAVPGDSGGAVFLKRGSQWELVGVLFTILVYPDQPYETTAVFGSGTLSVDVWHYREQIEDVILAPEVPALPGVALALAVLLIAEVTRKALTR